MKCEYFNKSSFKKYMQIKNYKNSKITYIKEEIERKSILYYLEIYYIKEAKNLFTFQQKF